MMDLIQKPRVSLRIAAFFCIILYLAGIYCRPLFPVDETRYLSVAWEMYSGKNWLVPHLNLQPYDHKPPLLFWCINLLWHAFSVSQEVAMALPFLCAFLLVMCTQRLAGKLMPDEKDIASATYILIGFLPFVVYSNMIMFDILLSVFVIIGITSIWDYARTSHNRHLVILSVCGGLGLLTKGPVILLHLVLPVLLARFWNKGSAIPRRKWVSYLVLSFLVSLLLGLCWAIPASIKGGPDFSDRIFWGQTAGRMANSFDHQKPFWWYLPFMPLFLAPWIFSPYIWKGLKNLKEIQTQKSLRFLIVWLVPAFISFSLISGKQLHYLLPLLPCLGIIMAMGLKNVTFDSSSRLNVLPFLVYGILMMIPLIIKFTYSLSSSEFAFGQDLLTPTSYLTGLSALAIMTGIFTIGHKKPLAYILSISLSSLILMLSMEFQAKDGFFKRYDIRPVAEVLERNPGLTLAFTRNYHGEWGFLARLDRRVRQMKVESKDLYLKYFPNSLIVVRTDDPAEVEAYDIIFSMPYKMQDRYYIIAKKGRGHLYSR